MFQKIEELFKFVLQVIFDNFFLILKKVHKELRSDMYLVRQSEYHKFNQGKLKGEL